MPLQIRKLRGQAAKRLLHGFCRKFSGGFPAGMRPQRRRYHHFHSHLVFLHLYCNQFSLFFSSTLLLFTLSLPSIPQFPFLPSARFFLPRTARDRPAVSRTSSRAPCPFLWQRSHSCTTA